jgi:tRNA(fMet)-specific endonuclease VapC
VNGKLAVDTNAVIGFREGIKGICQLLLDADAIILPMPVLGELLFGAYNSAKMRENEYAVLSFQRQSVVAPIDTAITLRYARVRSELKKQGTPIQENDIWIAATCLQLKVPLLTNDRQFHAVKGLRVIAW